VADVSEKSGGKTHQLLVVCSLAEGTHSEFDSELWQCGRAALVTQVGRVIQLHFSAVKLWYLWWPVIR